MQICKVSVLVFEKMLQTHIRIPIGGRATTNSYNGIISCTGQWSVQETFHCTKSAVFQELVCVVVLLTLSHSLLCFLSCVPVHDLAIAPWQAYRERKVKTTASLSRMELIGD